MSEIERRLEKAAAETREASRSARPPGISPRTKPSFRTGWVVFAAAFAVVILVVGLVPILSGRENPGDLAGPSLVTSSTTSTIPAVSCSATGINAPADQDLPDAVASKRAAIIESALACDLEALEAAAGPKLNTSFGGGGFENLIEWESQGRGELGTLVNVLSTPFAVQQFEDGPTYYVWPAAFAYETWEEIPAEQLAALSALYTQEELDQIATFGSYAGWRVGINEDGDWTFFVAGD